MKHKDHVAKINDRVNDGHSVHLAGVKGSHCSLICSLCPSLLCPWDVAVTAQEEASSVEWGGAEILNINNFLSGKKSLNVPPAEDEVRPTFGVF